jgi:SAM-dependent methyltransferase
MLGARAELRLERALLKRTWAAAESSHLSDYLVGGYQSPLINVQSILARHHFIHLIAGERFSDLEREELEFAVAKNRSLRAEQKRRGDKPGQRTTGVDEALAAIIGDRPDRYLDSWKSALAGVTHPPPSVLEAACGSANDYRYLAKSGIAAHLDYRGFDLTATNIANARRNHPEVDFRIGDVLDIDAGDASWDWVVVHDLFEHLSPAAFRRAIAEVSRVARKGVIVSFFHMADIPEHVIKPLRGYHRNELSLARTRQEFLAHCSAVEAMHIPSFVAVNFGFDQYYNRRAYSFIVRK